MITIKPALPGDIDAIAAIHTHYVLNTVLTQPPSLPQTQETDHL
jgi:L-amino acid N-acyltransferase YncA